MLFLVQFKQEHMTEMMELKVSQLILLQTKLNSYHQEMMEQMKETVKVEWELLEILQLVIFNLLMMTICHSN